MPPAFKRAMTNPAGGILILQRQADVRVAAAGAADGEHAFVLGIDIEQDLAFDEITLQGIGAGQPGLFIHGEKQLQGRVNDGLVQSHGHGHGQGDAVVGAQGGVIGLQPIAFINETDGVLGEIVRRIGRFLADHVHVALDDHGPRSFIARRLPEP